MFNYVSSYWYGSPAKEDKPEQEGEGVDMNQYNKQENLELENDQAS